ncbi:RNA polymerase sigma factor sigA-like [Rutidosis leptorrhynchoides]|uniref:RNA polymerase sigma factor sigA-like n=1 Tax=Rutidosis leptorrhynchoides TaxID=125765 RepID=UPI003A9907AC
MMATTAVVGLKAGERLLGSSSYYSDVSEKLSSSSSDLGFIFVPSKNVISAKKLSNYGHGFKSNRHNQDTHYIRALKEHVDAASDYSSIDQWLQGFEHSELKGSNEEFSVDALLLLQKSLLEKQWNLTTESTVTTANPTEKSCKKIYVSGSGKSARRRRIDTQRKTENKRFSSNEVGVRKPLKFVISPELLQNRARGYVKGLTSDTLLTHAEVVVLSKKIKIGQHLEERKSRLKERLGYEPSEVQLAESLKISRPELQMKQIECKIAREKLAMSNVRLVMSVAQKYASMGAEIGDLVQGGLIGLLRGIEKYDSSRGFKISTYVYWWIRQGVSKALIENSRTLRLPIHMHERLSAIRNAKAKLEEKGITPSIEKIAESLNMSTKKVLNATEAKCKVFSLDRPAFPSLNGLPGDTIHSYMADDHPGNNPWHGVDNEALKDEVNKLMTTTLREREREIIRLYYGLDNEFLTWEDISRRMGLSRERVRQVGLVALEKLKHAARKTKLEAMLVEH